MTSIRQEFIRLFLVATAPLLLVIGWAIYNEYQTEYSYAEKAALRVAELTAADTGHFVADVRANLAHLTQQPLLQAMDPANCGSAIKDLLAANPQFGSIITTDREGYFVCTATGLPAGQRPRIVDAETLHGAVELGEPRISRPVQARSTNRWLISFVNPMRGADNRIVGTVAIGVDLQGWRFLANTPSLPQGSLISILSGDGTVITRTLRPEERIGRSSLGNAAGRAALQVRDGTARGVNELGEGRIYAFKPVPGTDWIVAVGFALGLAQTNSQRVLWQSTGLALLALVLAAFFALALKRRIVGPVRAMAQAARAHSAGRIETRVPVGGPSELVELAEDMNRSTDSNKLARAQLQAQLDRLTLLDQITRSIGERQDLQSIYQVAIRSLEERLPVDFCCVCRYDALNSAVTVIRVGAYSRALALELAMGEQSRIEIDQNGLSRSVHGELVYERDIQAVPFPFPQRLARGGLRSLVVAPLQSESRVFGILIAARQQADSFSSVDCEFLRQLSAHVALAARQAELHGALQQAYDDLRQTQQTVMQQERLRALGQMASGIAHDINNAISPVALYTESLLEREPHLTERGRAQLVTISRAIGDVAETVARMREFYRQREPQLVLTPVDLNLLVQQVVDMTHARWSDMPQKRGTVIRLDTELAPDLPAILGVESEVREALINLVFNAVDAMPEGGVLSLRTRCISRPDRGVDSDARCVLVEVGDTGVGMDESTRQRCLEPFFSTKGERGTGLGLAMVYGAAQRHGADIDIESAVGRGTTVRLSFPVPATAPQVVAVTPHAAPVSPLRILMVDDDPVMLIAIGDALEFDGHTVVAAAGGQAGIEAFHASQQSGERFDLVITDLGMPYIDGRKVASSVKEADANMPVIMLTGWGKRLVADGEIPANVDLVLSKPPKLNDLRAALFQVTHGNPKGAAPDLAEESP